MLNGAAVDLNRRAFLWGRIAAAHPDAMARVRGDAPAAKPEQSLDQLPEARVRDLTAYQDGAYAARYRALVARVRSAEGHVPGANDELAHQVRSVPTA